MDSSRAEVCSGEVPCLEGRRAEGDSFSTCGGEESQRAITHVFDVVTLQHSLEGP